MPEAFFYLDFSGIPRVFGIPSCPRSGTDGTGVAGFSSRHFIFLYVFIKFIGKYSQNRRQCRDAQPPVPLKRAAREGRPGGHGSNMAGELKNNRAKACQQHDGFYPTSRIKHLSTAGVLPE